MWDALRLLGAELFLRRAGRSAATGRLALLPVHAVTVTNALGHAFRVADDDQTRRLLILQAAGWLASMRDDLAGLVDLSMEGPVLMPWNPRWSRPARSRSTAPRPDTSLAALRRR